MAWQVQLSMNKGARTKATPNVLAELRLSDVAVHVEADAYRIAMLTMNRWAMYTRWCGVRLASGVSPRTVFARCFGRGGAPTCGP
jgi:hypothetical protein